MIGISLLAVGKIFALIALGLYIIFALVVVKQVNLMISTIEVGMEGLIRLVAWAHLLFSLFVFITALIIL